MLEAGCNIRVATDDNEIPLSIVMFDDKIPENLVDELYRLTHPDSIPNISFPVGAGAMEPVKRMHHRSNERRLATAQCLATWKAPDIVVQTVSNFIYNFHCTMEEKLNNLYDAHSRSEENLDQILKRFF